VRLMRPGDGDRLVGIDRVETEEADAEAVAADGPAAPEPEA
jgi:hypothetical protein